MPLQCAEEDRSIPIYMACGDKDKGIFENLKETAVELVKLGFDITWIEGEGYRHEWRSWNREIEAFMGWIPGDDPWYSGKGIRREISGRIIHEMK